LSLFAGLKFADVQNGLAAISKGLAAGLSQILAYMALRDLAEPVRGHCGFQGGLRRQRADLSDPVAKTAMLAAEIANGADLLGPGREDREARCGDRE
jgi:hypothetical protein